MKFNSFKLEEYLSEYEFSAPYLLCCSDVESLSMQELLNLASNEDKELWHNLSLGYTESQGLPILRNEIAKMYPTLSKQNILCFAGAEDGIFCSLYTLCEPGDHVIVLTPCYQSLMEIPKLKGCDITNIELKPENKWKIDNEAISQAIKPNTKCVVINFPHNPTGQVITETDLNELVGILDKHGIWLFSDEVYRLLGNPEEGWSSPAACAYSKAISLGVMSKSFGMAGLRIGWIACQDQKILEKIEKAKHYTSICNSAPAEVLSLIALKNKDAILASNNDIVANNLNHLNQFLNRHQDLFSWVHPQGGCTGFIHFNREEKIDDFCNKLVKEEGVLLMPASIYDFPYNYFRIGYGRKNMKESLDKLEKFLSR